MRKGIGTVRQRASRRDKRRMSKADPRVVEAVMIQVRAALGEKNHRPVVIGLCGAQGLGKTTLARAALDACGLEELRTAALSIDDLYLTRAEREGLARNVHPLLATRGVPGTHDVLLGLSLVDALQDGKAAALPRFDKGRDDRAPADTWASAPADCDVLLFEGWCVGARPQPEQDLVEPINALEAEEDAGGDWRRYVNAALAGAYQDLFARIDRLVLLAAPGFEVVYGWRLEQERDLGAKADANAKVMDEAALARFIAHYERLTRYILYEMPDRADLVVSLDAERYPVEIQQRR